MNRDLAKVMAEGQEKTLEAMELMKKQVAGTITSQEETRLAMLNGNLLALAGQATELGFNPTEALNQMRARANAPDEVDEENEDYDPFYDEDGPDGDWLI